MNNKNLSKAGFTLIEIILVVVIIAILASFAVKNTGGKVYNASVVAASTDIRTLEGAITEYEFNNFDYPETLEGLLKCPKTGTCYLSKKKIPLDPWGNPYKYVVPGANNTHTYDLSCISPKGESINNWD